MFFAPRAFKPPSSISMALWIDTLGDFAEALRRMLASWACRRWSRR
jgi:hypothetical protein